MGPTAGYTLACSTRPGNLMGPFSRPSHGSTAATTLDPQVDRQRVIFHLNSMFLVSFAIRTLISSSFVLKKYAINGGNLFYDMLNNGRTGLEQFGQPSYNVPRSRLASKSKIKHIKCKG